MLPEAISRLFILRIVDAQTVLLPIDPVASIRAIILPGILSEALLLIHIELALILSPIHIFIITIAVHLASAKLPTIMSPFLFQVEHADPMLLIVFPVTIVTTPINPVILAEALFLTF